MVNLCLSLRRAEHLLFVIEYLSHKDNYNWTKTDLKLFLEVKDQIKQQRNNKKTMQELNPDGTIKTKPVEFETTSATVSTSTWVSCQHKNGTFFTVKFFFFRKRLFFCEDCHTCYDAKFIKKLTKMYAEEKPKN